MKINKKIKSIIILLVFLNIISTFATSVADNDGSAFITKAEFDSLKNNFQSQIDSYNQSIDSKIDGAIAAYLQGISLTTETNLNVYGKGLWWSIGPFNRPRWKQAQPIVNFAWLSTEINFNSDPTAMGTAQRMPGRWTWQVNWGKSWTNRKKPDNPLTKDKYLGRQVLTTEIDGTTMPGTSYKQHEYVNYMGDVSQFMSSTFNNITPRNYNMTVTRGANLIKYAEMHGEIERKHTPNKANPNYITDKDKTGWNYAAMFKDNSWNVMGYWNTNSSVIDNFYSYNSNYYGEGEKELWGNKVSVFAPMQYSFFGSRDEALKKDNITFRGYGEKYAVDTKIYCDDEVASAGENGTKNLWYESFYDPDDYATNSPWDGYNPSTDGAKAIWEFIQFDVKRKNGETTWPIILNNSDQLWVQTGPVKVGYGYSVMTQYLWQYKWYNLCQMGMNVRVDNWNQLFHKYSSLELKNSSAKTQAQTSNTTNEEHINLAAGLPVITAKKNGTLLIEDIKFKKNVDYEAGSTGNLDTGEAYIIYAKKEPFDITKSPEDETDLLDISYKNADGSRKDSDNKGKITKCAIVRNGKWETELELVEGDTLFIKWEKLSNWNSGRTARNEGNATDQDPVILSYEYPTLTPKWTYFGGGYLELPDTLKFKSEE